MITSETAQDQPLTILGPLHEQALEIVSAATGEASELDQLVKISEQAEGPEGEAIGWQIEGWIARHGSSLIPPAPPD